MIEVSLLAAAVDDASALVASFLKLIAEPNRRRIFLLLMQGETCNRGWSACSGCPRI